MYKTPGTNINIVLITIPEIARPLPLVPFLLQLTSPTIEKINAITDVNPQQKNDTSDRTNPAVANPSVLLILLTIFITSVLFLFIAFPQYPQTLSF